VSNYNKKVKELETRIESIAEVVNKQSKTIVKLLSMIKETRRVLGYNREVKKVNAFMEGINEGFEKDFGMTAEEYFCKNPEKLNELKNLKL